MFLIPSLLRSGPQTSSSGITWEHVRNAGFGESSQDLPNQNLHFTRFGSFKVCLQIPWYFSVLLLVVLVAKLYPTLCNSSDCSPPGSCPWDFPGKNPGVGCHFPLQGIFSTQRLNPQLLHWQADSLPLSHLANPSVHLKSESESHSVLSDSLRPHGLYTACGILQARLLEWVAVPFSRRSSQTRG